MGATLKFPWVSIVLVIPILFCTLASTNWYRKTLKKAVITFCDVGLLGGKEVFVVMLYMPVFIVAFSAILCGPARISRWSLTFPGNFSPESTSNYLAFGLYAIVQLGWILARLERRADPGKTLGLCAMVNLQVFLLPVSRLSPFLHALALAPESAVRFHRFLGWATLWWVLAHLLWYVVVWSFKGILLQNLFSMEGEIPIFAGVLAFVVATPLFLTSIPWVRRQYSYELFIHTHRWCSLIFAVCVAWHFSGILWWCVPSLLLYLSDHASQLSSWGNVLQVKYARSVDGVLSITLPCSGVPRPRPLQWVHLQVPDVSVLQWHPFTVASSTDSNFTVTMKVVPRGWTDALSALLDAKQISVRVGGPYGSGYTFEEYHRGRPLLMIAGGSGGTPFVSLIQAISEQRWMNKNVEQPAVTLVWVFHTEQIMTEFVCQTGLIEFARRCPKLVVTLFVTSASEDPVCPIHNSLIEGQSELPWLEFQSSSNAAYKDRKVIVALCHIFVSIGALTGLHHGSVSNVHGGYQFAYLLVGALIGTLFSYILVAIPPALVLEYRLHRRMAERSCSTPCNMEMQAIGARTHDNTGVEQSDQLVRRVVQKWRPCARKVFGLPEETAAAMQSEPDVGLLTSAEPGRKSVEDVFSYQSGRPDMEALMTGFEAQGIPDVKEKEDFSSRCIVMASGPPPLVLAASRAAGKRCLEFESLSFDL